MPPAPLAIFSALLGKKNVPGLKAYMYTYSWRKGWEQKVSQGARHGKAKQKWSLYHWGSQGDGCCYFIVGCPLRGHGWWVEVKHFYHVFPEHPKERSVPAQNYSSRSQRVKCQILYSCGHYKIEVMVSNVYMLSVAFYFKMIPFLNQVLPISGFLMTLILKNFLVTSSWILFFKHLFSSLKLLFQKWL